MTDTVTADTGTIADTKPAKKQPVVVTVTMDDGRVVEFPSNRRLQKTVEKQADGMPAIRLDFVNGETRLFKLPQSLLLQFAEHGALQKYGDEIAGIADLDDAILAVDELGERLQKGEWTVKREANAMAGTSILLQALMELKGLPKERVKTFLADKTPAQRAAMRTNPAVKTIIDRLEAAKVAKKGGVNTEELLAGLEAV